MKNILVLGLGVSGLSVCRHFIERRDVSLLIFDDQLEKALHRTDAAFLSECENGKVELLTLDAAVTNIERVDLVVASPGIPKNHPLIIAAQLQSREVICDVELACRELLGTIPQMVGITGSNGKTTVTLLTTHIMNYAGIPAQAVGNIGVPVLDIVESGEKKYPLLVVELSSFQLETMSTPIFQTGIVLNVTPNHLDYHGSMTAYKKAKLRLQGCIRDDGSLFAHESIENVPAQFYGFRETSDLRSDGKWVIRFGVKEVELPASLQGIHSHEVENFLAAYALCRECDISPNICIEAFASFKKPAHRIQFIREVSGVGYYDDSKGTNIAAVMRAVESVPSKVILIAGGMHKGESYSAWIELFQKKVRMIFAIGQAASLIENDLKDTIPVELCATLEEAVLAASKIAQHGESVLLSPGCSSYDMFKNYIERGERFQAQVAKL